MKLMQIVYPGLGGSGAVAFSLVEGQSKKRELKNFFLFYGVEKLLREYTLKCINLKIEYLYIKKKKNQIVIKKIFNFLKKKKPDTIVIHDNNLIPFYLYSLFEKSKLIYVHHTPDKTKTKIDWIMYILNSFMADKIVLVSKRNNEDLIVKINNILFSKKINFIENGINIKKFKK